MVGVELDWARRTLIANGCDPQIADDLLAACEAGAVSAWNKKDDVDDGQG